MATVINGQTLSERQKGLAACACLMAQGDLERLEPGMIIDIPEGVKHWHGAQKESWFQHLTTHVLTGGEVSNEWLEPVGDAQYNALK